MWLGSVPCGPLDPHSTVSGSHPQGRGGQRCCCCQHAGAKRQLLCVLVCLMLRNLHPAGSWDVTQWWAAPDAATLPLQTYDHGVNSGVLARCRGSTRQVLCTLHCEQFCFLPMTSDTWHLRYIHAGLCVVCCAGQRMPSVCGLVLQADLFCLARHPGCLHHTHWVHARWFQTIAKLTCMVSDSCCHCYLSLLLTCHGLHLPRVAQTS